MSNAIERALSAKTSIDPCLPPPRGRRIHTVRRGDVLPECLEQLANEPLGRPICHSDAAPGTADTEHFARDLELVWREHCAEGRDE